MTINNELSYNYFRIKKLLKGNCKTSYISSLKKTSCICIFLDDNSINSNSLLIKLLLI